MHVQVVPTDTALSSKSHDLGTHLPNEWQPLLISIKEFVDTLSALNQKKNAQEPSAHEEQQLQRIHKQITDQRGMLIESAAITREDVASFNFVIAKSFIIQAALKWSLSADDLYVDLAGSTTLGEFTSDYTDEWNGNLAQLDTLCEFCKERMLLSEEDVVRLKDELNECLLDVSAKKAIMRAVQEEFNLHPDAENISQMQANLFGVLYPGAELAAEDIKVILTSTMLFICLPLDSTGALTSPQYQQLTGTALEKTNAFLAELKSFGQGKFANFPAFGFLDDACCKSDSFKRIAERVGIEPEDLFRSLRKMVTILPIDEIDKYAVHDVWGHGWQATMLGFDHLYSSLARYAQPLDLGESARSSIMGTVRFMDCFSGTGANLTLNEDAFKRFVIAEIEERLPLAMTPVLAEMMADVIEYKFAQDNPHLEGAMKNSSIFLDSPAKLDLTVVDVPLYFSQATKMFALWADRESRQKRTINQLMTVFRSDEVTASRAVHRAVELWKELSAGECSQQILVEDSEYGLKPNLIARWYLNTVSIHHALTTAFHTLDTLGTNDLPLRSFKEILILSASIFFEQNPRDNIWKVDEFISQHFVPLCKQLSGSITTPNTSSTSR